MRASAEGEMFACVGAADIEPIRIGEHLRIAICGAEHHQEVCPRGNRHPSDLSRARRASAPGNDGGIEPQNFLDGVRDQRRLGDNVAPCLPVGQEPVEHVADETGRRFMSGKEQIEHDRRGLLPRQRFPFNIRRVHKRRDEVVARRGRSIGDKLLGKRPEPRYAFRRLHLLALGRPAVDEQDAVPRAFFDTRHFVRADAEDAKEDEDRQFPGEIPHKIGAAVAQTLAAEPHRKIADKAFHLGDALRRERDIGDAAHARMDWRIDIGERRHGTPAALFQRLRRHGARRGERRVGVDSGEGRRFAENLLDVAMARDDPMCD